MKKIIFSVILACGASVASAQQVVNGGFGGEWEGCHPWEKGNYVSDTRGIQPAGWRVANVNGMNGLGATVIAEKGDDSNANESSSSVIITNTPNPFSESQIVPGYFSIGTPWATAKATFTGSVSNADGGVFGGMDFTYQPDAISFKYKRTHNVKGASKYTNLTERASVVAYTWKGTWTQANVPSNTSMSNPTKVTMTDRSNNILGKKCLTGGAISKTDDAELLSVIEYYIEGDQNEWKELVIPFEYKNKNVKPEKMNIIFSANDLFADRSSIGTGNRLEIDDVVLVYNSELESLSYDGEAVSNDAEGNMSITLEPGGVFDNGKLSAQTNGVAATVAYDYNQESGILKVTVNGADIETNPTNCHVYEVSVIIPKIYYSELESLTYNGTQITPDEYGSMIIVLESGAIFDMDKLVAVANDVDATVNCVYDKENGKVKVTVYGGDIDTNPSNYHEYTVIIDTTTGITDIENVVDAASASYNLAGQRVADNVKGIIIKNGKKHIQ